MSFREFIEYCFLGLLSFFAFQLVGRVESLSESIDKMASALSQQAVSIAVVIQRQDSIEKRFEKLEDKRQ